MFRPTISALLILSGALFAVACHSDGLYAPCPLSNSILDACAQAPGEGAVCTTAAECSEGLSCAAGQCTDGTAYTCVVAEHPFCLDQICASWEGTEPVCTRACVIDDDCPGADKCMAHNSLRFCVVSEQLPEWSPFDQAELLNNGDACGTGIPCVSESECCPEATEYAGLCVPRGDCGEVAP
jgi:hypothetical protein